MNDDKRIISLISNGFDSQLAQKVVDKNYSYSKLGVTNKSDLKKDFYDYEVETIINLTKRQPIPEEIIERLVEECDWKCCVCWNTNKEEPVIIHHIEEHSKTRDDSYENLVVLCLNHHAIAHSKWDISRHPLPKEYLKQRKVEFINAIKEYKAGHRSAPGKENDIDNPFTHNDIETLKNFLIILDRPAMHTPLRIEGNMNDFLQAIEDIIMGFNTGIIRTREGKEIVRTKPRNLLSNPNWNEKMRLITTRLEEIRNRIKIAVLDKEMILREDGFFAFHNYEISEEIDAIRGSIILLFNSLLKEANISELNLSSLTRGRNLKY